MKMGTNTTALGNLVDLVMGQAPSSKDTNFEGRGTPFVKVGEFGAIRPVIREWTTNPLRMARPTDVLLCVVGATCGKINLGEDCAIGRSVAAIRPHPTKLDQFYLYYFMMSLVERLRSGSVGAAQTVISKEMVETVQIPVPPLAEQQRIVGLLDEAFEGLATAKANAEKNLQNARALFESHLQSVFTQRGEGWVEKRLDETCVIIMGQSPDGETYNTVGEGVPLINGPVEFSPDSFGKTVRSKFTTKPTKLCKKDDLILCVRGSTTGRINISGFDACIGRGVAAIRAMEYQPWINHFINAKREEIYRLGTGATFPNVSGSILGGLKLSVPALSTQKEIISKLDSLRKETQRLARLYERKLAALEELKKSLLHQAFSGTL